MSHMIFALFNDETHARDAIKEASSLAPSDQLIFRTHKDRVRDTEVSIAESEVRLGATIGVICGGIGGALLGALVAGPLGLVSGGVTLTAAMSTLGGSFMGGVMGTLTGSTGPHRKLEDMAHKMHKGQVMVTAQMADVDCELEVEKIFAAHGALNARRGVI